MNVCNEFTFDIGYFVLKKETMSDSNEITDTMKCKLLEMTNIPSDNFIHPFLVHLKKKQRRKDIFKTIAL